MRKEKGLITIDGKFKSLNINDIADEYRFIGGKKECEKYIKKMLEYPPKDIYVDRTVLKKYRLDDLKNVRYTPGYTEVKY